MAFVDPEGVVVCVGSVVLTGDRDGHIRRIGPAIVVGDFIAEGDRVGLAEGKILERLAGIDRNVGAKVFGHDDFGLTAIG